jgi:hypothetical protein
MEMVEAVRARHFWFLAGAVRWEQARKLLRELHIDVNREPILDDGWVVGQPGGYVIVIRNDLRGRRPTQVVLHELGHIFLHMQDAHGIEKHLLPCKRGDPREAEAELFARMLWYGPKAGPDNNAKIAEAAAAIVANAHAKRPVVPDPQLQLGIITGVPMYRAPAMPAGDGVMGAFGPAPEPRRRDQAPRIKVGDSHVSLLFDWSREGKPLRYFHLKLGWIDVWDTMPSDKPGRAREILVCGDRRAQWRDFIVSSSDRRRYVFSEREKRSRTPKELDRQIAGAAVVRPRRSDEASRGANVATTEER